MTRLLALAAASVLLSGCALVQAQPTEVCARVTQRLAEANAGLALAQIALDTAARHGATGKTLEDVQSGVAAARELVDAVRRLHAANCPAQPLDALLS